MDFDIVSHIADVFGILSFVISIPTFFFARSTKKAIQSHDDKKQYRTEISEHINTLRVDYNSIYNNDVYDENILTHIYTTIETIEVHYPTVVKKFKKSIKKFKKSINETTDGLSTNPSLNRRNIAIALHKLIEQLEKEEKTV